MLKNIRNILESDDPQLCRICLVKGEGLICMFDPCGHEGFRLWEILEELLQVEVSKEDGLPWSICKGCVSKVKEFKQFKMTCIHAKITLLSMIAKRGLVDSRNEEVNTDESPFTAVYTDEPLTDPLDLIDTKEGNDPVPMALSKAQIDNQENYQRGNSLGIGVFNVVSSSNNMGDLDEVKLEYHTAESPLTGVYTEEPLADPLDLDNIKEEVNTSESPFTGVHTDEPLVDPLCLIDVKEGNDAVKAFPTAVSDNQENVQRDNLLGIGVSNVDYSSNDMGDLIHDFNVTEGITKICEKVVCEQRDKRKEIAGKQFKRTTRSSGLHGEHSLRNNSPLPSVNAWHQGKNKLSVKERKQFKSMDCFRNSGMYSNKLSNDLRSLGSQETQLAEYMAYVCDYCGVKYMDKSMLVLHIGGHTLRNRATMTVAPNDLPAMCSELKNVKSKGCKSFLCEICGKEFRWKHHLTRHLSIHSGIRPFKCDTCGKRFNRKFNLMKHMVVHSDVKAYKCSTCGKAFKLKGNLVKHSVMHSALKPMKCEQCGKSFARKNGLTKHMAIHTGIRPFGCDTCGKRFMLKADLGKHTRIHTGFKPFKCGTCGKRFIQMGSLVVHLAIHSDLRPFKCDVCGKVFKHKRTLEKHSVMHSGLRPFKCNTCGKAFTQKVNLTAHSLVHSSFRPYTCKQCGKGFIRKDDLAGHSFLIHSDI